MRTVRCCIAVAAAVAVLSAALPTWGHTVTVAGAPADRPSTDMEWLTFPINEAQVLNNELPGAPADGSTDSAATGMASFVYDRDTDHLNYTVSWQNLGAPLLDIHVHGPATATQTTDDRLFHILSDELAVVTSGVGRITGSYAGTLDLADPPDVSCGCSEFDPEEAARKILAALLDGHAYLNLRTQAFQTGEIRGNFPAAVAAGEEPKPTPVPLPPGAWPAIATVAAFAAVGWFRRAS